MSNILLAVELVTGTMALGCTVIYFASESLSDTETTAFRLAAIFYLLAIWTEVLINRVT